MIFYFSATGNCKYVAWRIAEELSDTMISITECLKNGTLDFSISIVDPKIKTRKVNK